MIRLFVGLVMVVFGTAQGAATNGSTTTSVAPVSSSATSAPANGAPANGVPANGTPANTTRAAPTLLPLSVLLKARRANDANRETSSSSGEKKEEGESNENKESLGISVSDASSEAKGGAGGPATKKPKNKYMPVSSAERKGWRKWHRKCAPCPEIQTPWRSPSVHWICGAYQRARRTFKSRCMMRFRNCQDGTMFTYVHAHRCDPSTANRDRPFGDHFFYDYNVVISGDTTDTEASEELTEAQSSSDSKIK